MADYPKSTPSKRSASVKVMLHPDMLDKLRVLAEELGQAPSTLASIAVSQYVLQQTRALGATEKAMEGLFAQMAPEMVEQMKLMAGGSK
jgi:predicted transcriptional regulator